MTTPDELPGFRLDWLTITDATVIAASGSDRHPIVRRGTERDAVEGVCLDLDDVELRRADDYEVGDYTRVEVTLRSGRRAWVYIEVAGAGARRPVSDP